MKNNPRDERTAQQRQLEQREKRDKVAPEPTKDGAHGRPIAGGAPETSASKETFPERTKKPGAAGLANEARPGLGSRADDPEASAATQQKPKKGKGGIGPTDSRHLHVEPRPEPREQPSNSMAHELERSSGVSGQSGGT
jgi:hypothetical protein